MKKYKSNWILFISIITILLFSVCLLFLIDLEQIKNSRMNYKVSLYTFSIFAILIAPLFEEIIFRGVFTNNNFLKKSSILLSSLIGLSLFYSNYNIWITLLLFAIIVLNFYLSKNLTSNKDYFLVISNALLFGFVHYQLSDFYNINSALFVLAQISMGFLLIWITKNFGIIKSMFTHATFNFIVVFITFYSIQFVDSKTNKKESKNVTIQWNQVPFFKSNSGSYINEKNKIIIKNLDISNTIMTSGISDKKTNYFIKYPFAKFDITITSKNKKISNKEIIEAFELAKLISIE